MNAEASSQPRSVLIVDDDAEFAQGLTALLAEVFPDSPVQTSGSGQDALLRIDREEHELLLLDYRLPGLSGEEILAEIRHQDLPVAVVMITGQGDERVVARLFRAGADDYLVKQAISSGGLERAATAAIERLRLRLALERAGSELEAKTRELERKNRALEALRANLEERVVERTERLEKALGKLREGDRVRTEFLRTVTHELRTPLNAVMGYAELLLDGVYGEVSDRQMKAIEGMWRRGEDLLGLIDGLLRLNRIEAGEELVQPQFVAVHTLAREVLETGRMVGHGRSVDFRFDGEAEEWCTDADKLKQILVNLVGNAAKFTNEGSVVLALYSDEQGHHVTVTDTGPGVPEDQLESVFQPFRQVDGSDTRRHGGTGLGLTISLRLARLLGGSISVNNVEGGGSCFHLIIDELSCEK